MHVCVYMHMNVGALGGLRHCDDSPGSVINYQILVLGTKVGSSVRALYALLLSYQQPPKL